MEILTYRFSLLDLEVQELHQFAYMPRVGSSLFLPAVSHDFLEQLFGVEVPFPNGINGINNSIIP